MKIVLLGYMGSGKSFIGNELAQLLGFDFIDLDAYIEENEGQSIEDLFTLKGEIYFRKREAYYLLDLLKSSKPVVLALGGGTPCYGNNLEILKNSEATITIYLKASIKTLIKRLFKERFKRPLISHLNSEMELAEFIGKHLFERTRFYNQSDITISTDDKSSQQLMESIILQLI